MVFSRKLDRSPLRYTEDTDYTVSSVSDGKNSVRSARSVYKMTAYSFLEKAMNTLLEERVAPLLLS